MSILVKLFLVYIASMIRLVYAPAISVGLDLTYFQTWFSTTLGGISGIFIFFFASRLALRFYQERINQSINQYSRSHWQDKTWHKQGVRFIHYFRTSVLKPEGLPMKILRRFGLLGLVILTPVALSIPIGTFLVVRYYSHKPLAMAYLCGSVVVWALFMSGAVLIF